MFQNVNFYFYFLKTLYYQPVRQAQPKSTLSRYTYKIPYI